ncbi:MAG: hypothetical protein RLZZ292_3059 [Bacteroidota bacterium]|jgi:hypothetical protein
MLTLTRIAGLPYEILLQLRLQEGETPTILRERLQKILEQDTVLRRGLAFSSHTLLQLLPRYQHKKITEFRKKEFQIERAVLQYLSRAAAKTSPFSSFATIELSGFSTKTNDIKNELGGGAGRGFVFYFLQNILRNHPQGAQNETVQLNPTLRRKKKEFTCLVNRNNHEGIETIEANDGLAFFCDLLKTEFPHGTTIAQLTERASFLIEETPENVYAFLEQLLDLGILEWRDTLPPDWKRLSQTFDSISDLNEIAVWIRDFILYIETQIIDIEQVNQLYQRLKVIYNNATEEELYFRPEELIYDISPLSETQTPTGITLDGEINRFFSLLQPYHFNPLKEELLLFFKENYLQKNKKNLSISLLDFYEAFYKNRPSIEVQQTKYVNLHSTWLHFLEQKARLDEHGDLLLSLEDFELANEILAPSFLHPAPDALPSVNVFLQKAGNDYVVNGSSMGFGKQFAKTISLENIYKSNKKSELLIENRDASYFNGNQHFRVLEQEIWSAGSKNTVPSDQQISVADLKIRYDEHKDCLILKYKNKKITVLDFGLEPPEHRSPMYQLLNCFGVICPSIGLIKGLRNSKMDNSKMDNSKMDNSKIQKFKNSTINVQLETSKLETSNPKLETQNSKLETPKLETQNPKLETSKLETQNPKLETQNFKLETSNPKLETQNSKLETSKLETQNPKLETQNFKLETSNPKLETQNSKLETSNFKLETQNSKLEIPRIYLATKNRLILRRHTWHIGLENLPYLKNQEDEMAYFQRIRTWRTELNLPNPVFITLSDRNDANTPQSRDDYKPQYIDFESPLFVNLLGRLLKRVTSHLKIEEMLPDETMLEGGWVRELVVEIGKEKVGK